MCAYMYVCVSIELLEDWVSSKPICDAIQGPVACQLLRLELATQYGADEKRQDRP